MLGWLDTFLLQVMGGVNRKKAGRLLDGRTWDDVPVLAGSGRLGKSILSKAFRGELGTNNPNDEPAFELLKRSLKEKTNK